MYRRRKNRKKYILSIVAMLLFLGIGVFIGSTLEDKSNINKEALDYVSNSIEKIEDEDDVEFEQEDVTETDNQVETTAYYLVKREGADISVFYCSGGQNIELEKTGIIYDLLGPEDQRLFDTGVRVADQNELRLLLQDFES